MQSLPLEGDKPENIAALTEHSRISYLYDALQDKEYSFDPEEMAYSGVFYTIRSDGELHFYHGYICPEDDPERLKKASGAQTEDAGSALAAACASLSNQHPSPQELRPVTPRYCYLFDKHNHLY